MSILPVGPRPDAEGNLYADGRTKQAFKDQCDINRILSRAQSSGSISHLVKHGARYGDFADVPDLLTAHERIAQGERIYRELPSELRREFGNQFEFFEYVNNPANAGRLVDLLPALAKPGRQRPAVIRSGASELNPAIRSAPAESAPVPAAEPEGSE